MRRYQLGAHTKTDLKVHQIWLHKYLKRGMAGAVAIRTRDVLHGRNDPAIFSKARRGADS
ncbi:hypothetical protein PITCH_A960003 [uncultured Desulfobacterium sp.]|uniref:Uncharacterized protein n=1 Tax=uncultured Desulfobacterium sp. TaxID=201089 RepID=A0A445MVA7_9BACT|nr:hypothetical protein PITCH_A1050020 [uncultured Desulfobacterium sp.]SPD71850.1 hypothetical protein PITCH_A1070024 [uncultured Desulfobacterium sp.]SPD71999.1 hypothetical protein PITCH_A1150034 [uncultured Desulfobacterium sp.]SPD72722.1 hypothetical protein PITCH_A1510011 [uncultured Desulfobacterium sp.]SPD72763.1 hypothetical protein PITCH_A1520021 [uncultured Desulfobacterium sp.]